MIIVYALRSRFTAFVLWALAALWLISFGVLIYESRNCSTHLNVPSCRTSSSSSTDKCQVSSLSFAERQKVNKPNGSTATTNHVADQWPLVDINIFSNVDCHSLYKIANTKFIESKCDRHQHVVNAPNANCWSISLSFSPSPPHFSICFSIIFIHTSHI